MIFNIIIFAQWSNVLFLNSSMPARVSLIVKRWLNMHFLLSLAGCKSRTVYRKGRSVTFWYTPIMTCKQVEKLEEVNSPSLIDLMDFWRLWQSGRSWKYSLRISLVKTCPGTSTTWCYFDDINVWWISPATLCLHLPRHSDHLTRANHLSEAIFANGRW